VILILLDPLLLGLTLSREPNNAKRDVKGLRTILLVAAAQTALTAISDEIHDLRRIS
jgi:uncharacterized membrane protein YhiD involved in acid resistance